MAVAGGGHARDRQSTGAGSEGNATRNGELAGNAEAGDLGQGVHATPSGRSLSQEGGELGGGGGRDDRDPGTCHGARGVEGRGVVSVRRDAFTGPEATHHVLVIVEGGHRDTACSRIFRSRASARCCSALTASSRLPTAVAVCSRVRSPKNRSIITSRWSGGSAATRSLARFESMRSSASVSALGTDLGSLSTSYGSTGPRRTRLRISSTQRWCATENTNARRSSSSPRNLLILVKTPRNTSLVRSSASSMPCARKYPATAGAWRCQISISASASPARARAASPVVGAGDRWRRTLHTLGREPVDLHRSRQSLTG